jgi:hypothetical protein
VPYKKNIKNIAEALRPVPHGAVGKERHHKKHKNIAEDRKMAITATLSDLSARLVRLEQALSQPPRPPWAPGQGP